MNNQSQCHIDLQLQHRLMDAIVSRCAADWVIDLYVFAPRLVDVLVRAHDQPMHHFEPVIRQILRDSAHYDEGGDACECDPHHLDQHVHIVLEVLEELRQEHHEQSQWADVPVPPLMCG